MELLLLSETVMIICRITELISFHKQRIECLGKTEDQDLGKLLDQRITAVSNTAMAKIKAPDLLRKKKE
ncbi:hypothetical protein HispidOSU_006591 [Sigmodon hispidus]